MAAFSQLADFAKNYRAEPAPGVEVIDTPRYQLQLIPDFPIPGPNHVTWVRCRSGEADEVIDEATAIAKDRGLTLSWILDPETEPPDFGERLQARGIMPEEGGGGKSAVMILPAASNLQVSLPDGLEIRDSLADLDSFEAAERVAAEAFAGIQFGDDTGLEATRERRFANNRAAGNRHGLLATVDGEPAGSGTLTVFAPGGAIINGGAVRPKFRGRGVYRALVAARLRIAREAGAAGLVVWGGHMSAPILTKLGFETVSWRRFYQPSGR
jgi:GNAT superfamily N-acetyltransferase